MMIKKYYSNAAPYIVLFSAVFFVYALVYANTHFTLNQYNVFNSYSLQAYRWLQGYLDLGQNYSHLEIAIFNNRYWISFPPLPSIIMLPFVAILRSPNTPDHYIALFVFLVTVIYAYKIAYHQLDNKINAVFFALFLTIGTNYLQISMRGIVWHIAQNLAFMFTLMSIYYAVIKSKKHSFHALFFLCCAMGSRPMQAIYLPLILLLIYYRENEDFFPFVKKLVIYSIPALILGIAMLTLNYVRFGSVFEFGHNHLPASIAAEHGQLSIMYMSNHLRMMFLRIPTQLPIFSTHSAIFQPIAIWIISPIVICYVVCLLKGMANDLKCEKLLRYTIIVVIPLLIFVHLLFLASHKDVGGPQIGYRYTIDVLPVVYIGMLAILGKISHKNDIVSKNLPLFIFGFALNMLGLIHSIGVR